MAQLHEDAKDDEIYYGTYDPSLPTIKISGETAVYKKDNNCEPLDCDSYVVLHGGKIFFIANLFLTPTSELDKNQQRQIFDQILSTFKFTN